MFISGSQMQQKVEDAKFDQEKKENKKLTK